MRVTALKGKISREKKMKRTVMIVDDERINRLMLGNIVKRDYEVLYAENGVQALDVIEKNARTLSLILLDIMMPQMDGFRLLEILDADESLRRIPVIVLTSEKSVEVKSLKLGAADFIPKPYDMPEVILARIQRSIELAEDSGIINATETDVLTGLYTREYFQEYCAKYDLYYPDTEMDAIVLNINRFHLLNELYGRNVGDEVLCAIARELKMIIDGTIGIACRCEPDTFLIYIAHGDVVRVILERISQSVKRAGGTARVSIRMGIFQNIDRSLTVPQRFDRATHACNTLRSSYHTACSYYDMEMHKRELYNENLVNSFESAIEEKQFLIYFQPKYNIRGDEPVLISAEALIRWQHPTFGMVSPVVFIPLFESNGLIRELDRYIWREAAVNMRRWKELFGIVTPVSVNVSRADLFEAGLEETLLDNVRDTGLQPADCLLEITESAYSDNDEALAAMVGSLRDSGFRIEMDDFGSGYSSLNMLTSLPIDALKLDMKFIRNICESAKDLRMVELVKGIAEFMDIPVIAEGVETREQYLLLKKIGIDVVQGYYFSRPLPAAEFEELLKTAINQLDNSKIKPIFDTIIQNSS